MKRSAKVIVLTTATLQGSYMLFDGVHKLVTGSYFGGRLGPWADLLSAVGINPYSVGPAFVVMGVLWLVAGLAFAMNWTWSRPLLLFLGVISLAYLAFGTILSSILLTVMIAPAIRRSSTPEGN